MAERYDYDAIAEDDALLDLLAAGGDAAVELRGAGDDPAIQLLAELRLAVEEVDERPAQVLVDADDFLNRVAARNPVINEELARKIATRGLALSVAAVAALSVSGVAAAVNGDPLAPYEKVISRVVDAVRPPTTFPVNRINGLVIGNDGKLSKAEKADLSLRQSERDALANEDADPSTDPWAALVVTEQRPMARPQPPFVLPPEQSADVKITTATDTVLPPASPAEPKAAPTTDPPPAPTDPALSDPTGTVSLPPSPMTDPPVLPPDNPLPPSDTGASGNGNNAGGNNAGGNKDNGTPATTDATPESGTGAPTSGTLEDQSSQTASEDGTTANNGDGQDPAGESGSGGAAHDDDGAPVTAPVTDTATQPAQAATDGGALGGGTENAQSVTKSANPGSKADTKAETKTDAKTAKAKAGSKAKVKATAKAHRGAKALWAAKRAHAHGHAFRALALRHGAHAVTAHSRHGHGEVRRLPNISDMRLLAAVTSAALGDGDSQD